MLFVRATRGHGGRHRVIRPATVSFGTHVERGWEEVSRRVLLPADTVGRGVATSRRLVAAALVSVAMIPSTGTLHTIYTQ